MRYSSAVVEAWRNVRTGTTRAGLSGVVLGLLLAGLVALDVTTVGSLQRASRSFDRSAASTKVLVAEGQVNGRDCDGLRTVTGVRGSGAIRPRAPLAIAALPANPLQAYGVTPGLADVLGVQGDGTGAWVSRTLATMLGVGVGSQLVTGEGPLRISGLFDYPEDGRDARLTYALLVPELPDTMRYDECWASSWPSSRGLDDLLRTTSNVVAGATTPLTIGQLNNAKGPAYDPAEAMGRRVTRWVWVGMAVAGFGLGLFSARRRRLEYASALHAGQARSAQVFVALLEAMVWVGLGVAVAVGVALSVALRAVEADRATVLLGQLPGLALAGVAALAGVLAGVARTKESHLFAYFKDR